MQKRMDRKVYARNICLEPQSFLQQYLHASRAQASDKISITDTTNHPYTDGKDHTANA